MALRGGLESPSGEPAGPVWVPEAAGASSPVSAVRWGATPARKKGAVRAQLSTKTHPHRVCYRQLVLHGKHWVGGTGAAWDLPMLLVPPVLPACSVLQGWARR